MLTELVTVEDNILTFAKHDIPNGKWIIFGYKINEERTPRDYQCEYFLKCDIVRDYSGYTRTELHQMFKEYQAERGAKSSTKNLTVEEWIQWLQEFSFYVLNNYNIML